ncbi:unnamed protein product [Orchesella dallaii]|uniref:Uncharacterized protein n=1 Tax=Orchesella dallaii TaxID=48710 RepID=A0ABP1QEB5_9HEXA
MTADLEVSLQEPNQNHQEPDKIQQTQVITELDGVMKEVKIQIPNDASEDAPNNISTEISLSDSDTQSPCPTVEFSQEKDAPEVSVRVYDFDMVKMKTLPRNQYKIFTSCSSQPTSYVLAGFFVAMLFIIVIITLIVVFLVDLKRA